MCLLGCRQRRGGRQAPCWPAYTQTTAQMVRQRVCMHSMSVLHALPGCLHMTASKPDRPLVFPCPDSGTNLPHAGLHTPPCPLCSADRGFRGGGGGPRHSDGGLRPLPARCGAQPWSPALAAAQVRGGLITWGGGMAVWPDGVPACLRLLHVLCTHPVLLLAPHPSVRWEPLLMPPLLPACCLLHALRLQGGAWGAGCL